MIPESTTSGRRELLVRFDGVGLDAGELDGAGEEEGKMRSRWEGTGARSPSFKVSDRVSCRSDAGAVMNLWIASGVERTTLT